ncbi:Multidrug and toxin extrusion protein [Echinococcus multilocularis]|uniref:Multidrug and toxin extrusion protein n=1 Tax=Echinococcus multilocularis TaxID=6211 RepID=A0A0S4MJ52_ECHMU|nr:Multidrug and toxin extrusion protein [Echinococcus multilocularis]
MLNNFESLIYCTFPLGFCVASTMRIGQFLGANKAEGAISTSCVAIFTIGFWLGLCLGTGLESVVYIVIIKRIDWNEMCRKATKRTEIKFINRPPEQPDIVVKEEEARSLHEGDANLKACAPTTVCTRAAFILFCVSTVVAALVCRFKLDWKAHFPSYCLLNNGTILEINSSNVVQSSTYCHRILP